MSSKKDYFNKLIKEINKGDIIALDNDPMAYYIIDTLKNENKKVSIISISTDVIQYVAKYTNFNLILPNGKVNHAFHVLTGINETNTYKKYQIQFYFAVIPYIDGNDLLHTMPEVATIQRALINQTTEFVVINNPEKVNVSSSNEYHMISELY